MPRIQGLAETGLISENQQIKACPGEVHSITIAFTGVTAGQRCYLRDGTSGSSAIEVMFIFPASHGTITKEWPQGKRFDSAIYWDQGAGPDTGIFCEMTYK
jgi:hypothetical protein